MNLNFALFNLSTGEIVAITTNQDTTDGQGAMPLGVVPADYAQEYYIKDFDFCLRPRTSFDMAGNELTFSNAHPFAICTLTNADDEVINFAPQSVTLTDEGRYILTVDQPFPYTSLTGVLTVD